MKMPNWIKWIYWAVISLLVSWVLYRRLDFLVAGHTTPFDTVVFVVWIALLLAPIFSEIKIWGISLKQQIEEAKLEIKETKDVILREVNSVRSDVRNSVNVSPIFQSSVPAPPPDSQLPSIRAEVERALAEKNASGNYLHEGYSQPSIPREIQDLFSVRYQIEQEVRRIAAHFMSDVRFRTQIRRQVSFLVEQAVISPELAEAVNDVYRICSPAIHGDSVSQEKINFVRDVAPRLIETLQAVPTLLPD